MENTIHPNTYFQQFTLTLAKEQAHQVETFLLKAGAIGSYEILYQEGISNLSLDNTCLVFFFPQDFPAQAVITLSLQLLGVGKVTIEPQLITYADYVKMFEDSFKAFPLSQRFWLVPPWDKQNPSIPHDALRLYLKPGLAFGTGRHPTSRLVISFLEEHVKPNTKVLDLGTGSGILAIAAALLGATQIQGVDIETLAIESAQENFTLNQPYCRSETKVEFFVSDFSFRQHPKCLKELDIFVANILPNIFYQNQQNLFYYLQLAKQWALSGIPKNQADDFKQFLKKGGFLFSVKSLEGWLMFYHT